MFTIKNSLKILLCGFAVAVTVSVQARILEITAAPNFALPVVIVPGQTATALYEVRNIDPIRKPLPGVGVVNLPRGVKQIVAPGFCGGNSTVPNAPIEWFYLAPNEYCILNLQITADEIGPPGSVSPPSSHRETVPKICGSPEGPARCNFSADALNVTVIPATAGGCLSVTPTEV